MRQCGAGRVPGWSCGPIGARPRSRKVQQMHPLRVYCMEVTGGVPAPVIDMKQRAMV